MANPNHHQGPHRPPLWKFLFIAIMAVLVVNLIAMLVTGESIFSIPNLSLFLHAVGG